MYVLSLHDALPISRGEFGGRGGGVGEAQGGGGEGGQGGQGGAGDRGPRRCAVGCARVPCHPGRLPRWTKRRSEEHTSELQSQSNLVCRLPLEKKTTRRGLWLPGILCNTRCLVASRDGGKSARWPDGPSRPT